MTQDDFAASCRQEHKQRRAASDMEEGDRQQQNFLRIIWGRDNNVFPSTQRSSSRGNGGREQIGDEHSLRR
jgi:hypothetical protein